MIASTALIWMRTSFPARGHADGRHAGRAAGSAGVYRRGAPIRTREPEDAARSGLLRAGRRLGVDRHVGEVQLRAAARADRVVELHDLPAARALAAQLVALGAVERGGQ